MPTSRLRRLRALLRSTASPESMDRLNDIPVRPEEARPRPSPAMVMAPDKSRFQRHSAHLRTRILGSGPLSAEVEVAGIAESADATLAEGGAEVPVVAAEPKTVVTFEEGDESA